MSYKTLFESLLLEFADAPNPNVLDGDTEAAFQGQLDDDTDSEAYLTQGIKDVIDRVQSDFNQKMTSFANALSPEAVKRMPLGELKDKVGKVFNYVNGIQVYSKAKVDSLAQNPNGILAAFISAEPAKQAAFEELHKRLQEFVDTIEETESAIGGLKGKIDGFIENVAKTDSAEAAANIASQGQGGLTGEAGGPGNGGPSGAPRV